MVRSGAIFVHDVSGDPGDSGCEAEAEAPVGDPEDSGWEVEAEAPSGDPEDSGWEVEAEAPSGAAGPECSDQWPASSQRPRAIFVHDVPGDAGGSDWEVESEAEAPAGPGCNDEPQASSRRAKSIFVRQLPGDGDGDCDEALVQAGSSVWTQRLTSLAGKIESAASGGSVVAKKTAECVLFRRAEMLRGTRMAGVLRTFGQIFINSQGSAATFELSCPVKGIDVFISHNWSTPRLDKFASLALYFNWTSAFWAMWVFALVTIPLGRLGAPFALDFESSTGAEGYTRQNIIAHALGPVVLLLALAGGHEVSGRLGCKGPVAFLDKTCIHQTDAELKQEGIASLAAFLANSRVMLIVYSSTYLQKLWHRMLLLPSIAHSLRRVPGMSNATTLLSFVIIFVVGFSLLRVLEDWAKDRAEIREVVQSFSIRNAVCFDEKDRLVVQSNIVSFVRDLDLLPTNGAEEDEDFHDRALDAFDELVRDEVPPALLVSFGRQGIPYTYVLTMFSCQILRGVDVVGAMILDGAPFWSCVLESVEYLTVWMAICPMSTAALYFIAARQATAQRGAVQEPAASEPGAPPSRKKRRKRCRVCVACQFTAVMTAVCAAWFSLTIVSEMVEKGNTIAVAIFAVQVTVMFMIVAFAYRPVKMNRVKRNSLSGILGVRAQDHAPLSTLWS